MKVLIVNTYDIEGGAARAAYRLHRALLAEGINSQMLVQSKTSDDVTVIGPVGKIDKALGKIRPTLDSLPVQRYKRRTKTLFSPAWLPFSGVVNKINELKPDVVHLHWVAGGMLRIEDIARINSPIVWSLHDNWAFTGGCHIMWECTNYQQGCGKCPRLASNSSKDLSSKVFHRKLKAFSKVKNLTVVGLSSWLQRCASKSHIFSGRNVVCLPNPIDTTVFSPFDKSSARKLLNLPINKLLILFGAVSADSDINKGYKELKEALSLVKIDVELVVFGASKPSKGNDFDQKVHYLGRLHDDVTLRALYSAADVMVVPSRQEAFGQTASEAMACGTPVVAFGATGLLDIIDHKVNGYLAAPFNIEDLAKGIDWILNADQYKDISSAARDKITQSFDYKKVASQYIYLYRSVIKEKTQ